MSTNKNLIGWSVHEAYLKAYKSFEDRLNDTYTWIDEALAEAKKTFDTTEIKLIPKTPSAKAKRGNRKRLASVQQDDNLAAACRPLRSKANAENRESKDSGVDFDIPKKTRNKKQSRFEGDESVSYMDSVQESSVLTGIEEDAESSYQERVAYTGGVSANSKGETQQAGKSKAFDAFQVPDPEKLNAGDGKKQMKSIDRLSKENHNEPERECKVRGKLEEKKQLANQEEATENGLKNSVGKTGQKQQLQAAEEKSSDEKMELVQIELESKSRLGAFDIKKLSEEFHLKDCSVHLSKVGSGTASDDHSAASVPPEAVRNNLFPSPSSTSFNTGAGAVGSSSTGGRLLNFVKNAVGALIPSVMNRSGNHSPITGDCSPTNVATCKSTPSNEKSINNWDSKKQSLPQSDQQFSKHKSIDESTVASTQNIHSHGPRLSISQRRSSSLGSKAKLAKARKLSGATVGKPVAVMKLNAVESPEMLVDVPETNNDDADLDSDSDAEISDTPPQRVTRSKMRPCPRTVVKQSTVAPAKQPDAVPVRVTRSKMKVREKQPTLPVDSDDDGTPVAGSSGFQAPPTPSTVTRGKPLGQKVQQLQQMLCQNPSFALRDKQVVASQALPSPQRTNSAKRPNAESHYISGSPPKRPCAKPFFLSPDENKRTQAVGSYSAIKASNVADQYTFLTLAKKKATTPTHNTASSVLVSFLQKPPTPKILTREEVLEKKRRELEDKNKKMEENAQKRQEQMQRKMEEQRRQREERIQQALRRRQEIEEAKKLNTASGSAQASETASRAVPRQQPDERTSQQEKQKLRDKRIAEAEQRRKQEEETKRQLQLQQEREKQLQEEQARRRREQEEAERQQRLAEQRRQDEERRMRLEKERQQEAERLRQLEEQRLKEEQERQRAREERERKEKAEKERLEMERAREKERQKLLEIERQKEMERIRIAEDKARADEERRIREEQQRTQKAIEKHNMACKQGASVQNKVLQVSQTVNGTINKPVPTVAAAPKPVIQKSESVLNRTIDKGPESYELTPQAPKKPATVDNYNIDDLNSDDSTDEEDKPRKKIPAWAEGTALRVALINQIHHPPDLEKLFGKIDALDLNDVFVKKRPRFNKRTSSAIWEDSILLPSSPGK